MPMRDWTKVRAGTYHNFHVLWMASLTSRLNAGLLPAGYFAMAVQVVGQREPDGLTLQTAPGPRVSLPSNGSPAAAPPQPRTQIVTPIPEMKKRYAEKAHRVAIHHELGRVVSLIEIVSPGNKDRAESVGAFVAKAIDALRQEINLLIIDPFPPGPHDPRGMHGAILDAFEGQSYTVPSDKPLTLVAYQAEPLRTAYVEPLAVGERLLEGVHYIWVPLEETYQATWDVLPKEIRRLLETT